MLCERCKQNPATVHVTHIINGEKVEMHLCEPCAKQTESIHFDTPISFQDFLTGLLDITVGNGAKADNYDTAQRHRLQCPVCQMIYEEFRNTGRFGCAACYHTFEKQLNPIFKRLHGGHIHTGKLPQRAAGKMKICREITKLKYQLQKAVEVEEFEKAAELRDQIRAVEREDSNE
jgi:protein arginine kinase activator